LPKGNNAIFGTLKTKTQKFLENFSLNGVWAEFCHC
jgi:hypothetical protein